MWTNGVALCGRNSCWNAWGPSRKGRGGHGSAAGADALGDGSTSVAEAVVSVGAGEPGDGVGLPPARDLRDRHGRMAALAQVLATRESVLMLTCSLISLCRPCGGGYRPPR